MTVDRRQFFRGGIAAATLAPWRWSDAGEEAETCGLAIGTYGLPGFSVLEAIELVSSVGYDAIEITVFPDSPGDPRGALKSREAREEVREALEKSGLRLCALMADLKPSESDEKHLAQLTELRDLVEMARDLSPERPPLIQTVLGGRNWEDSRNLFRDRLANWNQILADWKGYLSIKPHRGNAMSTPAQARDLLESLGNPRRLRMTYDYSHYAFRGEELSVARTVAESLPVTRYVAVKDAVRQGEKVRFALAGSSGTWDPSEMIRAFYEGGYRGDFCCEVSSQIWKNEPDYDPVEATKSCYNAMASAFETAGVPRG